ncbi:TetR-like C-terminal domain-containing protein [Streptomyces sp. NPDC001156]
MERLRPEAPPHDFGTLREDPEHWAVDFLDEMSSTAGRSYIRDALAGDPDDTNAGQCSAYVVDQVEIILARAAERGEHVPGTDIVRDHVAAPMMYRILFRPGLPDAQYARDLVTTVFYRLMPLP